MWHRHWFLAVPFLFAAAVVCASEPSVRPTPESRAVAFLAREVPRWSTQNKCYSCHNNGDAARALYSALRVGHAVPAKTLVDTTAWLRRPEKWDHNGGEGPANDKVLARIQFAAALAEAIEAGQIKDRKLLTGAAKLVAEHQQKDGSWKIDADGTVGSPATHGTPLATVFCSTNSSACRSRKALPGYRPGRCVVSTA